MVDEDKEEVKMVDEDKEEVKVEVEGDDDNDDDTRYATAHADEPDATKSTNVQADKAESSDAVDREDRR